MGLVAYQGQWKRPEAVADQLQADPSAGARRVPGPARSRPPTPPTASGRWRSGASEHGLKDQATAHFTAVIRLDPSREAAWKRLGYKKHGGRWVTDAQVAAEKAEADAQKHADRTWKPLLERYRRCWLSPPGVRRPRRRSRRGHRPRAVPMIGRVFAGDADPAPARCSCSARSTPRRRRGRWRSWPSSPGRPRPAGRPPRPSEGATPASTPTS